MHFGLFLRLGAISLIAVIAASGASAQMMHGGGMGHTHGADGTGHDEMTMPGLRGLDATPEESAEMAVMFRNFRSIERSVENLPNGIRTVTRSDVPEVMDAIVSHAVGMIDRVGQKSDPQVFIQSPTLDIVFARAEGIKSAVEVTEEGLVVVQTSDDPELIAALHTHAAEVSDMAERGMQAVHEMMMRRAAAR
ncbi:hypothetical protein ACN2XU_11315 [Primorskyibacter sp. 2E107]|uniref:hypothetical protein n=1 Tax=Primorskyibacter sp. 2E107 TaxID=3403458 RepID=UPI003AF63A1E